ncbi:FAD-binding and (Fe-S)-binding domain-containing protein [Jiangella sp. DSM 45060]|uniref:FAD-binding and (Fe-S)-binding domain-containing protein n=1 Tax=Jiangella sp. DSM 45060 TaxID=1798224 RepID=UPI000B82F7F3
MDRVHLPTSDLVHALRRAGLDADAGSRRRAEYSSDASNYRVVPEVVVFPRTVDDVLGALEVAREHDSPVTARGGGTSVAGNAVGPGTVLDLSRHLGRVLEIDPRERVARVEPGCLLGTVQREAAAHGLRFGPDPSTWARCTIGGMIGNNACGPRALGYGRTADNVRALDVVDGAGRRFMAGRDVSAVPGLERLVDDHLALIRTELGRFSRQLSGYSLDHLLPENGHDVARALVGTEGTCVTVLGATIELVEVAASPALLVLGYPDMPAAGDDVPALLGHRALAIEGLDARLVDVVRRHYGGVPDLPKGAGWLLVEVPGATPAEAVAAAGELARAAHALDSRVLPAGPEATAVWRIREDGAGLAGRTPRGRQAWPGLEDAAVPPARLGAYMRDFEALLGEHDLQGLSYGHFGDGCIHVRLDLPLDRDATALRRFMEDAARLLSRHGGSLSGEHGDGRARGELLRHVYSPEVLDLFAAFKGLFDPDDRLNPGVLVRPAPLDADLRRPAARTVRAAGLALHADDGDLTRAAHRCVGVGKCRADNAATGGFMCPSYLATRDEKDSTRGRARVLQELTNGSLVTGGWRSPELAESLDLCLSCKACSRDCPAGVDIASLKSEVLYRKYRRRPRPISHYTLGWLPRWARLAARLPGPVNWVLGRPRLSRLALGLAGVDPRRSAPRFATTTFRRWWERRADRPANRTGEARQRRQVLLWADTFTDTMSPSLATATVELLESAGYDVLVPDAAACCGLPWISTGQLDGARRRLARTLDALHPYAAAGIPILGLEPSCTAVLRSDLQELLPGDARSRVVAGATHTLAELLRAPEPVGPGASWTPPDLAGVTVVVQPHCHHHAVMGFDADLELLRRTGAAVAPISGCCGLAGNFGMERGHYDVSVAVARNGMLPALEAAPDDAVLLADGFSCRLQAGDLAGRRGLHLAELLAPGRRPAAG